MSTIDTLTDADLQQFERYLLMVRDLCKDLRQFFDDWGPVAETSLVAKICNGVKQCDATTTSLMALLVCFKTNSQRSSEQDAAKAEKYRLMATEHTQSKRK